MTISGHGQINEDPEFTAELEDIFETISDQTIKGNIKFILKREKLWDGKFDVIFPVGGFRAFDSENDCYQYDFDIYNGDCLIASGTCYGQGTMDFKVFEIGDMTLEIMEGLKLLKDICDKERVNFT
jgi:hypothetical protein